MKKQLLILSFLCLIFPAANHAQNTFAPVGAEWWYGGDCLNYDARCLPRIGWADHMQSVTDTNLLDKPARMLTVTRYQKAPASAVVVGKRDTFYVYNTSDTVFVYDKTIHNFTALYVFNIAAGDTVCLRRPNYEWNPSLPDPEFCVVIDSVVSELYDGEILLSYYNHTVPMGNFGSFNWGVYHMTGDGSLENGWKNIGKYTRKIGGNWPGSGSFFPATSYKSFDVYKEMDFPTGALRCYTDPATNIKMTTLPCDTVISPPPLSVPRLAEAQYRIAVFPNPSSGTFRLILSEPLKEALELQVADLTGRVLYSSLLPAGKTALSLELGTFSTGIYLLLLEAEGQRYYQKLVINR